MKSGSSSTTLVLLLLADVGGEEDDVLDDIDSVSSLGVVGPNQLFLLLLSLPKKKYRRVLQVEEEEQGRRAATERCRGKEGGSGAGTTENARTNTLPGNSNNRIVARTRLIWKRRRTDDGRDGAASGLRDVPTAAVATAEQPRGLRPAPSAFAAAALREVRKQHPRCWSAARAPSSKDPPTIVRVVGVYVYCCALLSNL